MSDRGSRPGRGHQSFLGYRKRFGRKITMKVMASEPLPYQPARLAATSRTKTEISRQQGLQALKKQARAIEARLCSLDKRISELKHGFTPSDFKACVDSDRCVGCGTCQDVCPTGAIFVDEIAAVDPKLCTGCGRCVERCPRGALALHPLKMGYKEQACVVL